MSEAEPSFSADVATWLSLPPAAKRARLLPVTALFQGAVEGVTELLPYAPEDFQCTICFAKLLEDAIVNPPPCQCSNGHLLCHDCAGMIAVNMRKRRPCQKCPVCKVDDGKFVPLPHLKRLAENSLCMCPHGCGGLLRGTVFARHTKEECPMRPVVCPVCAEKVSKQSFLAHLRQMEDPSKHVFTGGVRGYAKEFPRVKGKFWWTTWKCPMMLLPGGVLHIERTSLTCSDPVTASVVCDLCFYGDDVNAKANVKINVSLRSGEPLRERHATSRTVSIASGQPASNYNLVVTLPKATAVQNDVLLLSFDIV